MLMGMLGTGRWDLNQPLHTQEECWPETGDMTQSVFSQNALDQACALSPHTTVCSTDLLPASLLVHIGSDTLRSPISCQPSRIPGF